jgi:hypothetical protein
MTRIIGYLKSNVLAAIALFVALGGTSYAATQLPGNSVGAKQIQNHSITPTKFKQSAIGGVVRAWAYSDQTGKLLASRGMTTERLRSAGGVTSYAFGLKNTDVKGCAATASVTTSEVSAPTPGSAVATMLYGVKPPYVSVETFDAAGQPAPLPFVVEVLC